MSNTTSTTNLFRRLSWQAAIPLEIRLADGEPGAGSGADRYYMHVPRYTYLPLLIPEIREHLVEICLDDEQLEATKEAEWWFEEEHRGGEGMFSSAGPCKWHHPLDLLHLQSLIAHPLSSTSLADHTETQPLRLILHLSNPPTDRLFLPNNIDTCKQRFMNQLKEADLARWRNTSRVTALRRVELDAAWEGIVNDDYDAYSRVFSRLAPPPIPTPTATAQGDDNNSGASTAKGPESSYTVRALPVLIYLPDGVPVIQEVVQPTGPDGAATTLIALLRKHLPKLFPDTSIATPQPISTAAAAPSTGSTTISAPTTMISTGTATSAYPLAIPLILGVEVPPETELAWLAGCMCGADGWVRIGIRLRGD